MRRHQRGRSTIADRRTGRSAPRSDDAVGDQSRWPIVVPRSRRRAGDVRADCRRHPVAPERPRDRGWPHGDRGPAGSRAIRGEGDSDRYRHAGRVRARRPGLRTRDQPGRNVRRVHGSARGNRQMRVATALALGLLVTAAPAAQQQKQRPPKAPNEPYVKLAEPWPDAETRLRRKIESETLPRFLSDAPLALTIKADFKAINKDRYQNSAARYAATISVAGSDAAIPAELGSRGHARLNVATCAWVPLRVMFNKARVAGTV